MNRRHLIVLVLVCLGLFFFGLGDRPLWDTDEGMHASTSRVMVETGEWFTPMWNGQPFYDKPPLFNWLVALSFSLLGFTELAARLPAALAGLATVLLTYAYARPMFGERAAFLGAIVLASSLEFVVLSRVVVHDIVLALFVALACFAFWAAYVDARRRTVHLVVMYAATGLAVLAKGPVGAVLPGATVLLYLVVRRDIRFIASMKLWLGVLLVAAIAVPAYAATAVRDPDYLRYFLIEKNFGSFSATVPTHDEPWYFYVPVLLGGLFPWSAFLPAALWPRAEPTAVRSARVYTTVWAAVVFGLFSLADSKLPTYLLPLFPAVAVLIGSYWDRVVLPAGAARRRGFVASYAILGAIVAGLIWWAWTKTSGHRLFDPEAHAPHLVGITAFFATVLVLGTVFLWRRADRALFATTAAFVGGLVLYLTLVVGPVADSFRSSKEVALWLDDRLAPGEELCFYPKIRDSTSFYTGRLAVELHTPDELAGWLEDPGAMCVVQKDWADRVAHLRDRFRVVFEYGNKVVVEAVEVERIRRGP